MNTQPTTQCKGCGRTSKRGTYKWGYCTTIKECKKEQYHNNAEYKKKIKIQAKEWYRERIQDPEWKEKIFTRNKEQAKKRYHNNPEWKEKRNAQAKEWYRERIQDPEYKTKRNAQTRDKLRWRRANDPEWKKKRNAQTRDKLRWRRANDPEWKKKRNAQHREQTRERRKNDPEWKAKADKRSSESKKPRAWWVDIGRRDNAVITCDNRACLCGIYKCGLCKRWYPVRAIIGRFNYSTDMTIDHILPVSTHPHLKLKKENLQLACMSCNASKNNKVITIPTLNFEKTLKK